MNGFAKCACALLLASGLVLAGPILAPDSQSNLRAAPAKTGAKAKGKAKAKKKAKSRHQHRLNHVHKAMKEMHQAKHELEHAGHGFGGHRAQAVQALDYARIQLQAALKFADHPKKAKK